MLEATESYTGTEDDFQPGEMLQCFPWCHSRQFLSFAAAACFVDPGVLAETLIKNDDEGIQSLLLVAEDYIAHSVPWKVQVREEQVTDDEEAENESTEAPETTPGNVT